MMDISNKCEKFISDFLATASWPNRGQIDSMIARAEKLRSELDAQELDAGSVAAKTQSFLKSLLSKRWHSSFSRDWECEAFSYYQRMARRMGEMEIVSVPETSTEPNEQEVLRNQIMSEEQIRAEFEKLIAPDGSSMKTKDGHYHYKAIAKSYRDFRDGWQAALSAKSFADDERVRALNQVFDNCRVIFFPKNGEYPIEHNPHANKISKDEILKAIASMSGEQR